MRETAAHPSLSLRLSLSPRFYSARFYCCEKAERKWNLLIQLLALSLSILCSISVQYGTCTLLILHPHSSQQAPERLLRPLVARLQSRLVLSALWHFPSGHTVLCPPACHYCCIAPCIVWCLAEAWSQLHLTHKLSRLAHWHSPQWFLSTSSYLFYYVRLNYTASVSCTGAYDNSLSAAVIISNGLCSLSLLFCTLYTNNCKSLSPVIEYFKHTDDSHLESPPQQHSLSSGLQTIQFQFPTPSTELMLTTPFFLMHLFFFTCSFFYCDSAVVVIWLGLGTVI